MSLAFRDLSKTSSMMMTKSKTKTIKTTTTLSFFAAMLFVVVFASAVNASHYHQRDSSLSSASSSIDLPQIYKWSNSNNKKRGGNGGGAGGGDGETMSRTVVQGSCIDPTEPFHCPDTNICISLQFLCDGHPGDCPDNYDEDESICTAAKRPPKDTIRRLLMAQYSNYGVKFIQFLFGNKILILFEKVNPQKAIDLIAISLAVSPNIKDFARVIEMTPTEEKRLAATMEALNYGQVSDLPPFIVNSASEGFSQLADKLITTNFLVV